MSDYQNEFVGNDTAEVVDNAEQSTDAKVNPGAIRKSTTSGILNALSNASGQNFESVEAAIAYMARTAAQQGSAPVGNVKPVEQSKVSGCVTTNDLHEQFNKLQIVSSSYALYQNFPNPFNPSTTILYQLPVAGEVKLDIYNILGQKVESKINEYQPAGYHHIICDISQNNDQMASGVYFLH